LVASSDGVGGGCERIGDVYRYYDGLKRAKQANFREKVDFFKKKAGRTRYNRRVAQAVNRRTRRRAASTAKNDSESTDVENVKNDAASIGVENAKNDAASIGVKR